MMLAMGGSEKLTCELDQNDIIRVTVTGNISKETTLELFGQLNPLTQRLRAQNKRVVLLVDQTDIAQVDSEATAEARKLIKNIEYDRVAILGASKENARLVKYLLNPFSRFLKVRFFRDAAEGQRWLMRGKHPLKRKAERALYFGLGFAALAVVWHFVIAPQTFRLPSDFSYTASVISHDNFYDEQAGRYSGETTSNTKFGYSATAEKDGVLNIKNTFDVRSPAGDKIFAAERNYGIDRASRQHVPGHGDRDRQGYLFGPAGGDKRDFTYWHINYNAPATMKFQNEEAILGLTTYHYAANFHADQTQDLSHLPGVGQTRGVNLDINLQLWIEPTTGYLVKYEDSSTAYYYDLGNGQRLNPWNQFSNSYSFESVVEHVRAAEEMQEEKLSNQVTTPRFFAIIAVILLIRWAILGWRFKHGRSSSSTVFSRSLTVGVVLVLMLALAFSLWRQTIIATSNQDNIQFQSDAHTLHDSLADELKGYIQAMQSAGGLFAASVEVDRNEWRTFVDNMRLPQNYPGMLAVGFVQVVPAAEKDAHVAKVRNDGQPGYKIHPEGARDSYSSVVFIEPLEDRNRRALGYDMLTEPTRRVAMERARDSGEPAISGKLVLIQDAASSQQYGVALYVPLYRQGAPVTSVEQRRAALTGYVYAPIRMTNFMRSTLGEQTSGLNIEVFDAARVGLENVDNRLYNHENKYGLDNLDYKPQYTRAAALNIAGHNLVVRYSSLPTYSGDVTLKALPGFILFVGLLLSFLITAIVFLQTHARSRAVKVAERMTNELRIERNTALINQHKNQAILSSIGDGVFVVDSSGKVILFNKAAELITGFSAQEVLGRPYKDVLSFRDEKDGTLVEDFITAALSGVHAEMAASTMLKRKDGTNIPVADSASPIVDDQGEHQGAVVVFRDVTHERQLERMKDEFLSVASHELRTPMGAIRANIAMLLDGDYGPVSKELVEPLTDMKASTVRLVDLVNDLLDVARIEAGRTRFALSEFKLQDVMKSTVASLAPLGLEKGVPITLRAEGDFPVQADPDKVKQAATNLIGNALKFTEKGSVQVTLSAGNGVVEVAVADTGVGISGEDQKKLFTRFNQITTTQDGKPAGTGLGLYISRELTRKMGGELWIKSSEPGKGSVFVFSLPQPGTPAAKHAKQTIDQGAELHPNQK
jgi:PAS domain S-box-containing protein